MQSKKLNQMINVVQILQERSTDVYSLHEIILNPTHIISMETDPEYMARHAHKKLHEGLHEAQQFSKILLTNGRTIHVVGHPEVIKAKTQKILHG